MIAYGLRDGLGNPAYLRSGPILRFELWASDYRQTQREQQRLVVRLLTQVARCLGQCQGIPESPPQLTAASPVGFVKALGTSTHPSHP